MTNTRPPRNHDVAVHMLPRRCQQVLGFVAPGCRQRVVTCGDLPRRILSVLTAEIEPGLETVTVIAAVVGIACLMKAERLTVPLAFVFVKPLPVRPFGQP